METIDIVVIVMAALASLTKLIDVISTILRVNVYTECNPIGVFLFKRLGVKGGCWATFSFWTIVCMVVAWPVVAYGDSVDKIVAIVIYSVLTYFCISTGLYNMKHISIPLTSSIIRFYRWLDTKMRK